MVILVSLVVLLWFWDTSCDQNSRFGGFIMVLSTFKVVGLVVLEGFGHFLGGHAGWFVGFIVVLGHCRWSQ